MHLSPDLTTTSRIPDLATNGGQPKPISESEIVRERLRERLASRRYNHHTPPPKPPPVLSLGGKPICTAGNVSVIQAGIKAGKSATVGGITAACIAEDGGGDTLGFSADNLHGKAVIHFDTEQTPHDHDQLIRRSLRRAGVNHPPDWFESYCLTDCEIGERREMVRLVLEDAGRRHGGIYLAMVDGIADLCHNVNDIPEANGLVAEIVRLAIAHEAPILAVLHENPGQDGGKTRGHLGSELARKAETNLRLQKDPKTGITTVWTEWSRHCYVPKDQGICFEWSDLAGAHVLCPDAAVRIDEAKRTEAENQAGIVFDGRRPGEWMTYGEIVQAIARTEERTVPTAKRRVREWMELGVLAKSGTLYRMAS